MKLSAYLLTITFTLMSISPAMAGHGRHYNSYGHGHGHKHRHYNNHRYGHRKHYRNNNAAYAIGGLIVGGVIAAALSNSYNSGNRYSNYPQPSYASPVPVNQPVGRSYMLQPDGSCYVVNHVNNGSLVLTPTSPRNCE